MAPRKKDIEQAIENMEANIADAAKEIAQEIKKKASSTTSGGLVVNIKKTHENAVIPTYARLGDAGCDLTAVSVKHTDLYSEYDTGLAFEIPEEYVGLLFPRSSVSKTTMILANSVGVLDSSYRGSVTFRYKKTADTGNISYEVGDRIGQIIIMPYPKVSFVEVGELSETDRGAGCYGSTGL